MERPNRYLEDPLQAGGTPLQMEHGRPLGVAEGVAERIADRKQCGDLRLPVLPHRKQGGRFHFDRQYTLPLVLLGLCDRLPIRRVDGPASPGSELETSGTQLFPQTLCEECRRSSVARWRQVVMGGAFVANGSLTKNEISHP